MRGLFVPKVEKSVNFQLLWLAKGNVMSSGTMKKEGNRREVYIYTGRMIEREREGGGGGEGES